jgi:hypothetical protein
MRRHFADLQKGGGDFKRRAEFRYEQLIPAHQSKRICHAQWWGGGPKFFADQLRVMSALPPKADVPKLFS